MSIFNIEIDFVKESERIIRISRISFWIQLLTILTGVLIIAYFTIIYWNSLLEMPLYIIFYTIAIIFLVVSSAKIYIYSLKLSEINTDTVKNEMKGVLRKFGIRLLISGVLIIAVLASISIMLPHNLNLNYHLIQGESIILKPQLNFQSVNINGIWISGNGTNIISSQGGTKIILNDQSINPSNEIYLAPGESYIISQTQGNSNLVIQYTGNYVPYYLSLLLSILSIIPTLYWVIRLRR